MADELVRFPALGSTGVLAVTEARALPAARTAVQEVLDAIDATCSRFREDSEIASLSRAQGQVVQVSPLLFDAIALGLRAAALTGGAVDPTIGQALRALGYDRDFDELQARGPARVRVAAVAGWQAIRINPAHRTVQVPAGVEIDLGATAKALAADRAAAAARQAGGAGVLVSLGGDMALAGPTPPGGWRVRVTDDHRSATDAPGQWITLHDGGLATSSTTVRRWATEHGAAHHLLDPATGRPVQGLWRTASVCAASCVDANIASTAAIVRGESAAAWLAQQGLPSRLVSGDGAVVHLAGWPQDGDDLPSLATPAGQSA